MDKLLVDIDQVLDDLEQSERDQTNNILNRSNLYNLKEKIHDQIGKASFVLSNKTLLDDSFGNETISSNTPSTATDLSTKLNTFDFESSTNHSVSQTNSQIECDSVDKLFTNNKLLSDKNSIQSSLDQKTYLPTRLVESIYSQKSTIKISKSPSFDTSENVENLFTDSTHHLKNKSFENLSDRKLNESSLCLFENSFNSLDVNLSNNEANKHFVNDYSSDKKLISQQIDNSKSNNLINGFVSGCVKNNSLDYLSTNLMMDNQSSTTNSTNLENIILKTTITETCEELKSNTHFLDRSDEKSDKINDVSNLQQSTSNNLNFFTTSEQSVIQDNNFSNQLNHKSGNFDSNNRNVLNENKLLMDQGLISKMMTNPFDEENANLTNLFEDSANLGPDLIDAMNNRNSSALSNEKCSKNTPCSDDKKLLLEDEKFLKTTTHKSDQQTFSVHQNVKPVNLEKTNLTSPQCEQQSDNDFNSTSRTNTLYLENTSFDSNETVHTHEEKSNLDEILSNSVGYVKPYWILDKDAPTCMFCSAKFNIINRRHHCRACGHIGCSICCHYYVKLPYLGFKEGRVCKICVNLLDNFRNSEVDLRLNSRNDSISNQSQEANNSSASNSSVFTNSTLSAIFPSSSSMRPADDNTTNLVSALKKPDRAKEQHTTNKQVIFFDGIRPGNDLTENLLSDNQSSNSKNAKATKIVSNFPSLSTFSTLLFPSNSASKNFPSSSSIQTEQSANNLSTNKPTSSKSDKSDSLLTKLILQDLNGSLPPIINQTTLQSQSTFVDLINYLDDNESNYLRFQITKNLCVNVNRIQINKDIICWSFTSDGLNAFGQDEILILLESLNIEVYFPKDILRLYLHVYDNALKGKPISDLNSLLFEDGLFENKENCGFLFFSSALFYGSTLKSLDKIPKPQSPFLVGILIQKWEIPWAKSLPLRLLLRLAAQTKTFPCSIISQRSRKSSFQEIGHTIMNVLADFRNFQYTLPFIPGLYVQLHLLSNNKRKVVVKIANNRHDLILKALNSSNDYVLAFGSNLELNANYHLTCMQNDDQYLTQIISKDGCVNDFSLSNLESDNEYISEIIGCNYIVFSGALKVEAGLHQSDSQGKFKFSIVEDGILVQLFSTSLEKLKNALKQKIDFNLNSIDLGAKEIDSSISIVWSEDDLNFNLGTVSQIDGRRLDGVQSIRIYNGDQYNCLGERYLIRFTEVFFLQHDYKKVISNIECTRMANVIAQQLFVTLTPHLEKLVQEGIKKISLRVNLDSNPDNVDNYAVSTNIGFMPSNLTTELDSGLIPLIIQLQSNSTNDQPLIIELIFFILNK